MAYFNGQEILFSPTVLANIDAEAVAPLYDSTETYAVGDLVMHDGYLYKCKAAIATAEEWTAAHWDKTDVSEVLALEIDEERAISERQILSFKVSTTEHSGYMKSDGTTSGVGSYHCLITNLIKCAGGDTFTYYGLSSSSAYAAVFYDSGKTLLSGESVKGTGLGTLTITAPNNAAYVKFSSYAGTSYSIELSIKDNNQKSLIDYANTLGHDENISINQSSTTDWLMNVDRGLMPKNYSTKIYENCIVKANGNVQTLSGYHCFITDYIPCEEGDTFAVYATWSTSNSPAVFYNSSKQIILACAAESNEGNISKVVTAPANTAYVRFSGYAGSSNPILLEVNRCKYDIRYPSVLTGAKWYCCGDSYTAGTNSVTTFTSGRYKGNKKVYSYIIGQRNGMAVQHSTIVSGVGTPAFAIGGMTLALNTTTPRQHFVDVYQYLPEDADYITLAFGLNDMVQRTPIGTISSTDNTTFYGAYNEILLWLLTNRPTAKIGIIIMNGITDFTADGTTYDFYTATINIAHKWGIPYLDMSKGEQVPVIFTSCREGLDAQVNTLRSAAFRDANDGHPNTAAHLYESTFIENWLKTL